MRAAGVELLAQLDELAVMGFAEVLPRLSFFRGLERKVHGVMDGVGPRLVTLIDYPGFNMRIARAARRRGIKVLYYVPPKVWAWGPHRAKMLAHATDRVAAILPFEADLLRSASVHAEYVGHPLLDRPDLAVSKAGFRERWGLDPGGPLLALLPGSREQEIAQHLDLFMAAAVRVRSARPNVQTVVSRGRNVDGSRFAGLEVPVVEDTRGLLRYATAALVKSGTATLEAALEQTPMVVAYRTSPLSWLLAKRLLRTEHVSLPNLVAQRTIVPEYLQGSATPSALADGLRPLLEEGPRRRAQLAGFAAVRQALGSPGTTDRVADLAMELMEGTA